MVTKHFRFGRDMVHLHLLICKIPVWQIFKSVMELNRVLLPSFSVCQVPWEDPWQGLLASVTSRGRPSRHSCLSLWRYSINNSNRTFICQASSWLALGYFRRCLVRINHSCSLHPFNCWNLEPYWVATLQQCNISLDSTRLHLLGRNQHKKRFCASHQLRVGLQYMFARIMISHFLFRFYPLYFFFHFPHIAVLRRWWLSHYSSHTWGGDGADPLMLQGTFRAHCCRTASQGFMSIFWALETMQQRLHIGVYLYLQIPYPNILG